MIDIYFCQNCYRSHFFEKKKSSRFKSCRNETLQLAYQSETRQRLLSFRFIPPIEEVRKF